MIFFKFSSGFFLGLFCFIFPTACSYGIFADFLTAKIQDDNYSYYRKTFQQAYDFYNFLPCSVKHSKTNKSFYKIPSMGQNSRYVFAEKFYKFLKFKESINYFTQYQTLDTFHHLMNQLINVEHENTELQKGYYFWKESWHDRYGILREAGATFSIFPITERTNEDTNEAKHEKIIPIHEIMGPNLQAFSKPSNFSKILRNIKIKNKKNPSPQEIKTDSEKREKSFSPPSRSKNSITTKNLPPIGKKFNITKRGETPEKILEPLRVEEIYKFQSTKNTPNTTINNAMNNKNKKIDTAKNTKSSERNEQKIPGAFSQPRGKKRSIYMNYRPKNFFQTPKKIYKENPGIFSPKQHHIPQRKQLALSPEFKDILQIQTIYKKHHKQSFSQEFKKDDHKKNHDQRKNNDDCEDHENINYHEDSLICMGEVMKCQQRSRTKKEKFTQNDNDELQEKKQKSHRDNYMQNKSLSIDIDILIGNKELLETPLSFYKIKNNI